MMFLILSLICSLSMADNVAKESASKDLAIARDYILGAGDLVRINVYGSPDMQTEARLSAAGTITFPLIGEVKLGGSSPKTSENKIAQLLEQGGFVKKAQVNLVVLQYQSQFVSVLGDVYKPGKYSLDRPSTLSDLLALAGGITPNGSDMVTLIRTESGKTTRQDFDLRNLITKADAASNPQVSGDDIIYVNAREVSVLGQVNRPGKYSVVSGVRTVLDFLSQAGGVSSSGADKIVVITQRNGKTEKHEIDVDQLYRKGDTSENFDMTDGDSIYVPRMPVFYIYGEVQRPGAFRLERNMNLAQALSTGGGLSARGTERGIKIKRQVNGVLETLRANAGDLLQADDVVFVGESLY
ncbi:MAG: SLBB domain-containing protein [Bacteroidia bacterium]|nr:SLBB domain-containing protein [Methylotenera sp.]